METDKQQSGVQDDQSENESIRKERILHKKRIDYPRLDHDHTEEYAADTAPNHDHTEEYAADIAPIPGRVYSGDNSDQDVEAMDSSTGKLAGYVALVFGVLSLFLWSIVLGPLAAVLGFYAYSQGRRTTGGWSIGLGILATLSYFVLMPFTR